MKQVKFDGSKWKLITENGGFFNPNTEVFFWYDDQPRIDKLVRSLIENVQPHTIYEIPDSKIYTAVCGPKCGPFWPDRNCQMCGGNGVSATFNDGYIQMGGTDEANEEVELIRQGKSNIHPELNH